MINVVNEKHSGTSIKVDERKLLLLMAAKGITNLKELSVMCGLSPNTFRTGFNQNEGYFSRRTLIPLTLLFNCSLDDLRYEAETPETNAAPDLAKQNNEMLKEILRILKGVMA